jgi:competence protein ComGC
MKAVVRRSRLVQQSGQAGLIGLLVVMLIVGILAGMLYPGIAGRNEYTATGDVKGPPTPIDRAYDTGCTIYMEQVSQAAFEYRQDHDAAPPDLEALKPYGVDEAIINTPNCNFGLPKHAGQPDQGAQPAYQPPPAFPQQPGAAPAGAPGGYQQQYGGYQGGGWRHNQQQPGAQPSQYPQQPGVAPASGPSSDPGYTSVGGVRVPTSSGAEGDPNADGQ